MSDSHPAAGAPTRDVRLAPAKVNLGLAITSRRDDGYHELRSVFLRIGLADELSGLFDNRLGDDRLLVVGDESCPVDGNTVLGVLQLLRASVPGAAGLRPLALELRKEIPLAAGLGGGSSDGAAAMDLAVALWGVPLAATDRARLAAQLGADVPFFAEQYPVALVTGIGDQLEPLPAVEGEPGLLLVTPVERLSTADVFAEFDRRAAAADSGRTVDELAAAIRPGLDAAALCEWAPHLRDANDLWPAAVRLLPSLERLRGELERVLDRAFLLSGSGSTLFGLYPSPSEAREAGQTLTARKPAEIHGATVIAAGTALERDVWRIQ